jgi:hypothetical protein
LISQREQDALRQALKAALRLVLSRLVRAWSAFAPLTKPANGGDSSCCAALAATEDLQP